MTALHELPNDVEALQRIIVEQRKAMDRLRAQRQAEIDAAVKAAVDQAVAAAVAAILRRYYGPRSERFDPRQLLLFGQRIEAVPLGYLRPIDYDRGDPAALYEARRRKMAEARHRRREKNLKLRQPTLPLESLESVANQWTEVSHCG
jgi:transposase